MSDFNDEILVYLSGPRDFDDGFKLLEKYLNNKSVLQWVQRKRHQAKLIYELEKLSKMRHLRPSRLFRAAVPPNTKVPVHETAKQPRKPQRQIDRNELPEHLQQVYEQINEAYKVQRVLHEKMKLATTNADRSALRAELVIIDDQIATGWDTIDSYEPPSGNKLPDSPPDDKLLQQLNNSRSAISKMIKSYNPGKKSKLLDHLQFLIDNNASISRQTHAKLVELNVVGTNTNLLVR
ncbi:MAG TPA: hypothetical protein PKE03_10320 [Bacteroidales bacterium]|nr:hypothetical protein [Bacteroidales bacterium]